MAVILVEVLRVTCQREECSELDPSEAKLLVDFGPVDTFRVESPACISAGVSETEHIHAHDVRDRVSQGLPVSVAGADRVGGELVSACESRSGDHELSLVSQGSVEVR